PLPGVFVMIRSAALVPVFLLVVACSGKVSIGDNKSAGGALQKNPDGSSTGNGQTCTVGGTTVKVGDKFPSPDGCNTCTCAAEGAYCTEMACVPPPIDAGPGGCDQDGRHYDVGQSFPSSDNCNTCYCQAGGSILCTQRACVSKCQAPNACP